MECIDCWRGEESGLKYRREVGGAVKWYYREIRGIRENDILGEDIDFAEIRRSKSAFII